MTSANERPEHAAVAHADASPERKTRVARVGRMQRPVQEIKTNYKPNDILEPVPDVQTPRLRANLFFQLFDLERALLKRELGSDPQVNARVRITHLGIDAA
jgi:hypothetical protein